MFDRFVIASARNLCGNLNEEIKRSQAFVGSNLHFLIRFPPRFLLEEHNTRFLLPSARNLCAHFLAETTRPLGPRLSAFSPTCPSLYIEGFFLPPRFLLEDHNCRIRKVHLPNTPLPTQKNNNKPSFFTSLFPIIH